VAQLEGLTERESVAGERRQVLLARVAGGGADEQRVLDGVLGALVADDVAGAVGALLVPEPAPRPHRGDDVEELPGHELSAHPREDRPRGGEGVRRQTRVGEELVAPALQEAPAEVVPRGPELLLVGAPASLAVCSAGREVHRGGRATWL